MEHRFTLEQIKEEVYYYVDKKIKDDEAKEIQFFADYNKNTPLGEIIEAYYSCWKWGDLEYESV